MRQFEQHYVAGAARRPRRRRVVVLLADDHVTDWHANGEGVRLRVAVQAKHGLDLDPSLQTTASCYSRLVAKGRIAPAP